MSTWRTTTLTGTVCRQRSKYRLLEDLVFSVEPSGKVESTFTKNMSEAKENHDASPNKRKKISETEKKDEFHFSDQPTLEILRQKMSSFAGERNWDQFHQPRNLLLALVGEVGELSEIFQWKGEVPEGLPGWEEKEKEHLAQELSDVLLYLLRLSDKCHIDLPAAAVKKMEMNCKKYPAKQCYGSSKKYYEYKNGDVASHENGSKLSE